MAMPMILPPHQFRMGDLYWNDLWEGVLGNGETWTVVDQDRTVAIVIPVPEVGETKPELDPMKVEVIDAAIVMLERCGVPIHRNTWPSGLIELHISPFMDAREP